MTANFILLETEAKLKLKIKKKKVVHLRLSSSVIRLKTLLRTCSEVEGVVVEEVVVEVVEDDVEDVEVDFAWSLFAAGVDTLSST